MKHSIILLLLLAPYFLCGSEAPPQKGFLVVNGLENDVKVFIDGVEFELPAKRDSKYELSEGEHFLIIEKSGYYLPFERSFIIEPGQTAVIDAAFEFDKERFKKSYKPIAIGLASAGGLMLSAGLPFFIVAMTDYFGYQYDAGIRNRQLAFFLAGLTLGICGIVLGGMSVPLFISTKERTNGGTKRTVTFLNFGLKNGVRLVIDVSHKF